MAISTHLPPPVIKALDLSAPKSAELVGPCQGPPCVISSCPDAAHSWVGAKNSLIAAAKAGVSMRQKCSLHVYNKFIIHTFAIKAVN